MQRMDGRAIAMLLSPVGLTGCAIFYLALFVTRGGREADLQMAAAALITAAPMTVAALQRPARIFHPLMLVSFGLIFGVFGQMMYLRYASGPAGREALLFGLATEDLTLGLVATALGVTAMLIGFLLPARPAEAPGRILSRLSAAGWGDVSPRRATAVAAALCVVALFAYTLYAPRIGLTSLSDLLRAEAISAKRRAETDTGYTVLGYHRWAMSLSGYAFLIAWYAKVKYRQRWASLPGLVCAASLFLAVAFGIINSSRTEALQYVVMAGLLWTLVRQREPSLRSIVGAVVAIFLVVSGLGGLRAASHGTDRDIHVVEQTFGTLSWVSVAKTSVVVDGVPDRFDHLYGRSLVSWVWAPVPRAIWEDKPPTRIGPELGAPLFGMRVDRFTGVPPGLIAEFFINFGWIGIPVGLLLYGALIRRLDHLRTLSTSTGGLSAMLYTVLALPLLVRMLSSDVTGIVAVTLQSLVTVSLLLFLTRRPRSAVTVDPDAATVDGTDRGARLGATAPSAVG